MSDQGAGPTGVPPQPPPQADDEPQDPAPRESSAPPPPGDEPPPLPPRGEGGASAPPPPHADEPHRVLRRSTDDRMIAGVAGGLGRYFGIDATLLRIAFVLLLFAGGSGLLLYVVGWIVMPEQRAGDAVGPPPQQRVPAAGTEVVGLILLVVGAFLLMRVLVPDIFAGRYVWPIALIVLGLALLLRGGRR
jgi:phage shock protein C